MYKSTKRELETTKTNIFNEKVNRACNNGKNNSDQTIYASMAHMSGNEKFSSSKFWWQFAIDQLDLDSGATCHMTPKV